jgi:hypothetical protein
LYKALSKVVLFLIKPTTLIYFLLELSYSILKAA